MHILTYALPADVACGDDPTELARVCDARGERLDEVALPDEAAEALARWTAATPLAPLAACVRARPAAALIAAHDLGEIALQLASRDPGTCGMDRIVDVVVDGCTQVLPVGRALGVLVR